MADVTVPLSGWGFSTWGTDSWGEGNALPVATGEVGSVTVIEGFAANVAVTGVTASFVVGNTVVQGDKNGLVLGNSATGEVGNPTVTGAAVFSVTGVAGNVRRSAAPVRQVQTATVAVTGAWKAQPL